jgi:hypothetical protein
MRKRGLTLNQMKGAFYVIYLFPRLIGAVGNSATTMLNPHKSFN